MIRGGRPSVRNLPGGLGNKGGKGEPVVVAVVLEICKGEQEKRHQFGRRPGFGDAIPHHLGMLIEQRRLVCRSEFLQRIKVLEHAADDHSAQSRSDVGL